MNKTLILILLILYLLSLPWVSLAQEPSQSSIEWDKAAQISSPPEGNSWFPDLAVDNNGKLYVVWCNTAAVPGLGEVERIFFNQWNGQEWLGFNDILPPQPDINRNAIAVDNYNTLHLTYGWFQLRYQQAQPDTATSATGWSDSRLLNRQDGAYLKDISAYQNVIQVVYDDNGKEGKELECSGCADIYYVYSPDRGVTWSRPLNLYPTNTGSARVHLYTDKKGRLYVVWDEGWDRIKEIFSEKYYNVFIHSPDGGKTWLAPTLVTYPNWTNTHITVGADGEGGVMLAWRTADTSSPFFYMWSADYGNSWNPPSTIPNLIARPVATGKFDMYDMATDSLGHIHYITVGYLEKDKGVQKPPALYHVEWDGKQWSMPTAIYESDWYPEYPHVVIVRGNQLYTTWFIRKDPFNVIKPHQIWFTHAVLPAPAETPVSFPTLTPTPTRVTPTATATHTPIPTLTPTPTLSPELLKVDNVEAIQNVYTDYDELTLLIISLTPAFLIVFSLVTGIRIWKHRRFRANE